MTESPPKLLVLSDPSLLRDVRRDAGDTDLDTVSRVIEM
jgi:hypothetical protein